MTEEDEEFERIAQKQLAALKKSTKATTEDAAVRAVHKVMAEFEAKSDHRLMENAQGDLERIKLVQTGVGIGQPEPMAYSYTSRITGAQGFSHHPMPRFIDSESWDIIPLYATPPQRTWFGLTDDEIKEIRLKTFDSVATNHEVYRAIESKLKEKNT